MTETEMLNALQSVWENMTMDKDRIAYGKMLVLLDNMMYFLRYDLQCDYPIEEVTLAAGDFDF